MGSARMMVQGAAAPPDDAQRVRALEALGILDTPPEPAFDDITALAAALFRVPMAVITFVDADRQWFKARVGLALPETSRDIAFCAHTIRSPGLFVVDDAHRDPRFADNPLVVDAPRIRFYAGAPLRLRSGHVVGSLAILDHAPRALDEQEREHLGRLARLVVDALDLRERTSLAREETTRARAREQRAVDRETTRRAAILDAALDAILLVQADGRVCAANPAAERLFGASRVELEQRTLDELLVSTSLGGGDAGGGTMVAELARGDGPAFRRPTEVTARGAGDRPIPVEVAVGRIPEDPPLYALFARDLAARRALEGQLREAQKLEAVGRLAGGIAHDFNNLLSVVLVVGQLARKKLAADDPLVADLDAILQGARRAATLTRQLLAIGRRQVLQSVPIDLDAMILDAEPLLRRVTGEHVGLALDLDPELPPVEGDPSQLQRVLMNLVINARDATPRGGLVTVATRCERIDETEARSRGAAPGRYVVLSVTDTGEGMDAATRERIFEPFFTTKKEGSGLGLAIVAGIVKQSGGHLAVTSDVGRGSTFAVRLPPVPEGSRPPASLRGTDGAAARQPT